MYLSKDVRISAPPPMFLHRIVNSHRIHSLLLITAKFSLPRGEIVRYSGPFQVCCSRGPSLSFVRSLSPSVHYVSLFCTHVGLTRALVAFQVFVVPTVTLTKLMLHLGLPTILPDWKFWSENVSKERNSILR